MSDGSLTPLNDVGLEFVRTAGRQLNTSTPAELAELFIAEPNFEDTSPEHTAVRIAQIMAYTETFTTNIRGMAPDWIDMDRFIIVTSGFASNPKFWGKIFELSARHHRYLQGGLTIPEGQEADYKVAHSPEHIAKNNTAFFGYAVMLLATAALYGNTMDNLPIDLGARNNPRLKAALNVSRAFEGLARTPEDFIDRLVIAFRDLGYNALQGEDAFRVKVHSLEITLDDSGELMAQIVDINRLCPFEGQASKHLLMGIALAFHDEMFRNDYLTHIRKNTLRQSFIGSRLLRRLLRQ